VRLSPHEPTRPARLGAPDLTLWKFSGPSLPAFLASERFVYMYMNPSVCRCYPGLNWPPQVPSAYSLLHPQSSYFRWPMFKRVTVPFHTMRPLQQTHIGTPIPSRSPGPHGHHPHLNSVQFQSSHMSVLLGDMMPWSASGIRLRSLTLILVIYVCCY
jgi:hypothetical protein